MLAGGLLQRRSESDRPAVAAHKIAHQPAAGARLLFGVESGAHVGHRGKPFAGRDLEPASASDQIAASVDLGCLGIEVGSGGGAEVEFVAICDQNQWIAAVAAPGEGDQAHECVRDREREEHDFPPNRSAPRENNALCIVSRSAAAPALLEAALRPSAACPTSQSPARPKAACPSCPQGTSCLPGGGSRRFVGGRLVLVCAAAGEEHRAECQYCKCLEYVHVLSSRFPAPT